MMELVALSLGGNLGDVKRNFTKAIEKLTQYGLKNISMSSCYTTSPVECRNNAPDFVNAALTGEWNGTPKDLLTVCKKLEAEAGRPTNYERNSDRPLDIDIILFGNHQISEENLFIPHKEMYKRLFVLIPLAEVAPKMINPLFNKTINELLSEINDNKEFEKIMDGKEK